MTRRGEGDGVECDRPEEGRGAPVAVGIGSNLGDREECLRYAVRELERRLGRVVASSVYVSEPRDAAAGGEYLNMCAAGVWSGSEPGPRRGRPETEPSAVTPARLLDELRFVEMGTGRPLERSRGEPRCLDLDLLLFGDRAVREPGLEVPHPRMTRRQFVLRPLAEIVPAWTHPVLGKTVAELAGECPEQGVEPYAPARDIV